MAAGLKSSTKGRTGLEIHVIFTFAVIFHFWGAMVGWESLNLPGGEFRQAQTAISTYFIQQEGNYALAYPTPVLGKPWSVPMEFPLYQWTVAAVSSATGFQLTQTARCVSLVCFYLTLPAIFLLLGRFGLSRAKRFVVLGLVLTCPLYIYYARAFLIESMALMFSAWFLVAFMRAVEQRSLSWLALANIAGLGAGLVKVTTFMLFLIPAGLMGLVWLWRARLTHQSSGWGDSLRVSGWVVAATALPFASTFWWIHFADELKRLNPNARFLQSDNLTGFNFGTWDIRFSVDTLSHHWQHIASNLVWSPVLAIGVVLAFTVSRRWWRPVLICVLCYIAALALFPILYALHDYYSVANGIFLLAALGLVLGGVLDTRLPKAWAAVVIMAVYAAQGGFYLQGLYQDQRGVSAGGSGLTEALNQITKNNDVLVIAGDDWSSITPYFARRRALMFREGMQDQHKYLEDAVRSLAGERVGAVVLQGELRGHNQLRERLLAAYDMDPRAVFTWQDATVYVPVENRIHIIRQLHNTPPSGVELTKDAVLPAPGALGGEWRLLADLNASERASFASMEPLPTGVFMSYGPSLEYHDGVRWFSVHPTTRLRFRIPAGDHTLRMHVGITAAAYEGDFTPANPPTDGVTMELTAREGGDLPRIIFHRLLDPHDNEVDRGEQLIEVSFNLLRETDVDLYFGPGPNGRDTRDWIWLRGPLVFE